MLCKIISLFQVPISPIESQTSTLFEYKTLYVMEHQTTKPERIQKLLQIIPRNCLNKL